MARPKGTDAAYREAVKIVEGMLSIKSWVNKNLQKALEIKHTLMMSDDTPANIKNTIAGDIIKLHAFLYAEQDGQADYTETGVKGKVQEPPTLLSLKFTGTDDN